MSGTPTPNAGDKSIIPTVSTAAPAANVEGQAPGSPDLSKLKNTMPQTAANIESIPANWNISPGSTGDTIVAVHNITGKTFEGTHKDFSKMIKGV